MPELIRLYLSVARLRRLDRYTAVQSVLYLLAVCALCFAVAFSAEMGEAGNLVLLILSGLCTVLGGVFSLLRERFCSLLFDGQYAGDQACASEEERILSERYYTRLVALRKGQGGALRWCAAALGYLSLIAGSVFTLLYQYAVIGSEAYVYCLLGVAAAVIFAVLLRMSGAVREESACSLFRVEMRREIAYFRARAQRAGIRVTKNIDRVLDVDHFLTADLRTEFRLLQKYNILCGIGGAAVFVLLFVSGMEGMPPAVAMVAGCVAAVLIVALISWTVRQLHRMDGIWQMNAATFDGSGAGELRRQLQEKYVRLQRRGNALFLAATVITVAGAVALTAVGYAIGEVTAADLWTNAFGTAFILLLFFGIAAFVVWAILYAVYRRRAAPVEKTLAELEQGEGVGTEGGMYEQRSGKGE